MTAHRIADLPEWHVVTGLETTIGEIPLIAIGPGGVFVVDSASAPAAHDPADVPERAIIHAGAVARYLTRMLDRPVHSLLAVDDAPLDGVGGRRRGVHVVPAALVPAWLSQQDAVVAPADVDALRDRLSARRGLARDPA